MFITILDKQYDVHACVRMAKDLPIVKLDVASMNISYRNPNNELSIRNFIEHMHSVLEADLSYPILLNEDGCIIDGRHRLCKALYQGDKTILTQRFDKDPSSVFTWAG